MSIMKCPHCGREYSQRACRPMIPSHKLVINSPAQMSAAALDAGAAEEEMDCPGSNQTPRNAEADRRPLWKDDPDLVNDKTLYPKL